MQDLLNKSDINILLVDDNKDILYTLQLALEQEGVHVFTTTVTSEVMDLCISKDISIILLDVNMPEINGIELLSQLKNNPLTEQVMVILITGQSMSSEDTVNGLRLGAVDFLFKPLDLYITQAKINSLTTLLNYQREIQRKNIELENSQQELFLAVEHAKQSKALKENFLANMSHEIRTPLTAILGLSHLLKTDTEQDKHHLLSLLEHTTQSLLALVNDILDSEKIDAGKIAINRIDVNIHNLIHNICDLMRPLALQKGLQLNCTIDPDIPGSIVADALRINQILTNLINNAIKFTEKGHIAVDLKVVGFFSSHVKLEIKVTDTGMGIAQESINKIFDRFEQADDKTWQNFGGTGLGLSIVKKLIELKGGTLDVQSEVGTGTTFTFTNLYKLSAVETDSENSTSLKLAAYADSDDVTILLAEDDIMNQMITTRILKAWNIKVDVAADGAQACEKLSAKDYDLILMDTHMPVMNGYEATRKIRDEMTGDKKTVPIISFSASIMESDRAAAREAGVDAIISKPFKPADLYKKIRHFLTNRNLHKA